MLQSFKNFISEYRLFNQEHTLLLALSGGADSICLFHLLQKGGFNFRIAHCNFKLRGEESDGDEQFVIQLAKQYNVPYFTISFDTKAICEKENTGIQETARRLRYDWFRELMATHGFYKLLTAHHRTDHMETMFINILRNTGIKGLHGIPMDENNIARPLLFATKSDIDAYLFSEKINFREDRSNASDSYLRNQLRHHVLPVIKGIDANAEHHFFETAKKIKSYEAIADELMAKEFSAMVTHEKESFKINKDQLALIDNQVPFLYYNLQQFGFTFKQIESIVHSEQIGKMILSEGYQLAVERDYYLMTPLQEYLNYSEAFIHALPATTELANQHIHIEVLKNNGEINFKEKGRLYLNGDLFDCPFTIRTWKEGDKLKPLGMKGYKKVSDILTDKKVENHLRKQFLVIETSQNEIIALLPDTIHNDYQIVPETKQIISIGIKIAEN